MGLLADYLPTMLPQDPNQNQAARQGLLQFGAALLGGKGNFGSILGQGIASGAGGYNSSLQALQQKALLDAQTKHMGLINDAAQGEADQNKAISAGLANFNQQTPSAGASLATAQPQSAPAALSSAPQASPAPDAGLPLSMFPQSNAAPVAPVSALPQVGAQPASATDPQSAYQKAVATAQYLVTNFPRSEQTKIALKNVEALKPKVKETKTVTLADGSRVLANFFEDGAPPQVLQGVSPDKEKLVGYGAGGTYNFADPFSGKTISTAKITQSEDSKANTATQIRVQNMITARQEAADKGEPEAKLQGDELRMMAAQYLAGDPSVLGNLGRGKQGAENIIAMRREITAQAKAAGMSGGDIAAKMAEFAGAKAGMRTAGTRNATIEIAASEVNQLAPIALEASANVSRSGFHPFGKAQIMFDASTNDPNLRKFAMANNALVNAYGQAMARGGTATVNDKQHAQALLSTAMNQASYTAAVQQLMVETKAAQAAPKEVTRQLSEGISGRGKPAVKPVKDLPKTKPAAGGATFLGFE